MRRALLASGAAVLVAAGCAKAPAPTVRGEYRQEPRDVALVLDTSGSMVQNDPNRMAVYAAKIFTDLMEPGDRVLVIPFPGKYDRTDRGTLPSERAPQLTFDRWARAGPAIGPLPPGELKARIERLAYDGQVTVFREPLEAALAAMDKSEGRGARALVLLSDGEPSRGMDYVSRVFRDKVAGLQKRGTRVFGIMLGDGPTEHFEILARATGGGVLRVARPRDLVDRFATVFSRILETRVARIEFARSKVERFVVRPYVKELILLVPEGGPGVQVTFQEPRRTWWKVWEDGRKLATSEARASDPAACRDYGLCRTDDASAADEGRWNRYSVFRVLAPRAGEWKVRVERAPGERLRALLIQNYDLYLELLGERERVGWVGEANRFVARLVDGHGRVVRDPELFEGARYRFVVRNLAGEILQETEVPPDDEYRMVHDYVPPSEEAYAVQIALTNGEWLRRRVDVAFRGVKDIRLFQREPAGFGDLVPWTDLFIETLGRSLNMVVPVWEPGRRRTCAWVDFTGSAPEALGVVFRVDNQELLQRYGARVVNEDGDAVFTVEKHAGGYRARVCLEAERWSPGGDVGSVAVPIRSSTGREISGTTELRIAGRVERLPVVWGRLPWWFLLELYIAAKLAKGVLFWMRCGFSRGCRVREVMEHASAPGASATMVLYPGRLGVYRLPVLPRILALPWYVALSSVNFARTVWVLLRWDHPLTEPTCGSALADPRRDQHLPGPPVDLAERRRRRRLAWKAVFWEGLLFSTWSGPLWRPATAVGRKLVVTRLNGKLYFARADERGRAAAGWLRRSQEIEFTTEDARFRYTLGRVEVSDPAVPQRKG